MLWQNTILLTITTDKILCCGSCAEISDLLLIVDSITCATAPYYPPYVNLQEVAICFGGNLLRGNRSQKINSSAYRVSLAELSL